MAATFLVADSNRTVILMTSQSQNLHDILMGKNCLMSLSFNSVYKLPTNYIYIPTTHGKSKGSHKWSFQPKWLNEHTWLAYSRENDGGYCVPCVFFCKDLEGLGKLVNSSLNKLKDSVNTLHQQSKKFYQMHAVSNMMMFMQVINNEQQPTHHQLVSALAQQVQRNRLLLNSIIKTVTFCGKQNIPLRGRHNDWKHSSSRATTVTFMVF